MTHWEKRSVGDLLERISGTMPLDSPGSLPRAAYVDIIAYLLRENHLPAGKEELSRDQDALKSLIITKK